MRNKKLSGNHRGKSRIPMSGFGAVFLIAAVMGGCGGKALSYRDVPAKNSPASYREFLFRSPGHPRAKGIRKLLDEADFKAAGRIHTVLAYRRYLEQHPSGQSVRQATFLVERLSYYDALSQMNPDQFKDFLKQFPKGKYASEAQEKLQQADYAEVRRKNTVAAYSKFLARYRNYRSEWTAAATQRLERLLLDAAIAYNDRRALADFIRDHPKSPYRDEGEKALKRMMFERLVASNDEAAMADFIRRYEGSSEVAVVSRRLEELMLRTAERTGRAKDLGRFLKHFPDSSFKERVAASLSLMTRNRNRQLGRWIKVKNGELEILRPRRCRRCEPVIKVHATVSNKDTDFVFDVVLESTLKISGGRCCQVTHRVNGLRPGEARPISFSVPGKVPSGPPPAFEIRIVKGSAYFASDGVKEPESKDSDEKPPPDRFAPKAVPPLGR